MYGPGDVLPQGHVISPYVNECCHEPQIVSSLFQTLQQTLTSHLDTICSKIDSINNRMDSLEARQINFETGVQTTSSCSTPNSIVTQGKRNRLTPVPLQVCEIVS